MAMNFGMLSGDPRASLQESLAAPQSQGERLGMMFGNALQGAFGRDMRTPQQRQQAAASQIMAKAADPKATSADIYGVAQQLLSMGMTTEASQLITRAEAKKVEEVKKAKEDTRISSLTDYIGRSGLSDDEKKVMYGQAIAGEIDFSAVDSRIKGQQRQVSLSSMVDNAEGLTDAQRGLFKERIKTEPNMTGAELNEAINNIIPEDSKDAMIKTLESQTWRSKTEIAQLTQAIRSNRLTLPQAINAVEKERPITIREELQADGSVREVARFNDADGGVAWTGGIVQTAEERKKKGYGSGSVYAMEQRDTAISEAESAYSGMRNADALLERYEKNPPEAGFWGDAWSAFKNTIGSQNAESLNRTAYESLRNSEIINSLPKGAASDKDVEVFSRGYPDASWNAEALKQWMRGYRKAKALDYAYKTYKAKKIENNEPLAGVVAEFFGTGRGDGAYIDELQRLGIVFEEAAPVDLSQQQRKQRTGTQTPPPAPQQPQQPTVAPTVSQLANPFNRGMLV